MYFDYAGFKGDKIYGIINLNCDDKGCNEDNHKIEILKFWGNKNKFCMRRETSDYWKITEFIDRKEKEGYDGLTQNLYQDYPILSQTIEDKLIKRYIWEKMKV